MRHGEEKEKSSAGSAQVRRGGGGGGGYRVVVVGEKAGRARGIRAQSKRRRARHARSRVNYSFSHYNVFRLFS